MVVDDAAFMRMMLKGILEQGGHEVICEAANGSEAVTSFSAYKPDLVTMDITMPIMDGIEAVKEIISKHPEAKILMCSAMGHQQMVIDAIRFGAKDFIVKPFHVDRVLEAVNRTLAISPKA